MIRNELGGILAAGGYHVQARDINQVELRALWMGLCYAIFRLRATKIWVEGDSLHTIQCLLRPMEDDDDPLLKDCKILARGLEGFHGSHIHREAAGGCGLYGQLWQDEE